MKKAKKPTTKKASILVVDDNTHEIQQFKAALDGRYDILLSKNGEEALEILSKKNVQLVYLNIKLAGANGMEVLRRIKSTVDSPRVIIMSGNKTTKFIVETMRSGAFYFMEKK